MGHSNFFQYSPHSSGQRSIRRRSPAGKNHSVDKLCGLACCSFNADGPGGAVHPIQCVHKDNGPEPVSVRIPTHLYGQHRRRNRSPAAIFFIARFSHCAAYCRRPAVPVLEPPVLRTRFSKPGSRTPAPEPPVLRTRFSNPGSRTPESRNLISGIRGSRLRSCCWPQLPP